jgi:hypothetical protein
MIDNLFTFDNSKFDEKKSNTEPNKLINSAKNNSNLEMQNPSLYQGRKFTNYQDKIKNITLENNLQNPVSQGGQGKEGFSGNTGNIGNSNSNTTNAIIANLQKEYDKTLNEYNDTLKKYNDLAKKTQISTTEYVERVNSNNKYLNKIVRFNTGQMYYVTNQGVAKYVPNADILKSISGKNGCPNTSGKYIDITIPWINDYSIEGTQIPTTPPLIVGKNMKANESCGHEGSNVFVNTMLSSKPTPAYVGCYQDNPASMTIIGGKQFSQSKIVNSNFAQPAIANNSYQYITSGTRVPGWQFNACILNNSNAWGYPKPYPNGNQCASLQQTQSFSQTLSLKPGSYGLLFWACGRNCCDNSGRSNPVNIQLNGNNIYSFEPPINNWTVYSTNFDITTDGNNEIKFQGTWTASDRASAITNILLTGVLNGTYNIDQCEDAAILGGNQYFSLQNANPSTGLGYCAVGNDINNIKKYGNGYALVQLWSSNTAGKPTTYATLTKNGTLNVCDSSGRAYFISPNGSNCNQVYSTSWNVDAPGNDITYLSRVRRENCEQYCTNNPNCGGFAWNRSTDNSCWIKSGKLNNYVYRSNNRILIKKTVDTSKCIYFLNLQNDGNMCIYRGTPNTTNITNIWCTYTNGKQQESNTNYSVAKSKYRVTFIKDGQVLNRGEWVVSADGKLLLIMQHDGNLVLYTFKTNCAKGTGSSNSKNYYGGNSATALYDIGSIGIKSNMGHLAYIDPDSQLHAYPSSNVTYSNTYSSVIQNTNIQGNDIPGAAMNNMPDITKCMNACNKYSECNAFVYDTTGPYPVCLPKKVSENDIYSPNTFKPSVGMTTYIRDKKPKSSPIGTDNTVTSIDSITYQNYGNQGGSIQQKYGLANMIPVQKQQLSQLQDKLNLLLSQLNKNVNDLKKYNVDMTNNTKQGIVEGFQDAKNSFLQTSQLNHKIHNLEKNKSNVDNILRDANIKTLHENYNYMLWSILALGTLIVAIKVKNTEM